MKKILLIILSFLVTIFISSCEYKANYQLLKVELDYSFDTICSVTVEYDARSNTKQNVNNFIYNLVNPKLKELEKMFSGNESSFDGFTKSINNNAGKKDINGEYIKTTCSKEYVEVLNKTLEYSKDHVEFNICIGNLTKLWNISNLIGTVDSIPTTDEINESLKHLDCNSVVVNNDTYEVYITDELVSLDFGAAAKGYTEEACSKILDENDVSFYVLNFGGSVIVNSTPHVEFSTYVGITNPIDNNGVAVKIKSNYSTYITSGSNYRYIEYQGTKYSHILNPVTGYPVSNSIASLTIINDDAFIGDILSTMCYVMGYDEAVRYLTDHNITALIITNDYKIYLIGELEYELTNPQFEIINY